MNVGQATAIILALGGPASAAMAAPCSADNVAGVWSLASIRADEPGVEEFYARAPNEWMRFAANGGYIYVATSRPLESLAAINASLDRADAVDGATYAIRWPEAGHMMILRNGEPFQLFRCEILEQPAADARAGDMILSAAEGKPMLRRVQRRVAR